MDFPNSKFRSRDRARARPRALRGIPRVAVWGLALGPARSPGVPRCSAGTFRWSHGSLGSSSSASGCNMVQISEDFEDSKFSSGRDRARAGPRALRVIARMEAWFWGTPWMTCLASPDSSGSVSVALKTIWVELNRHGGAGRRLKKLSCGLCCTVQYINM